jgi:hypothetical protein
MAKTPDQGWRDHVLSTLPKMEANAGTPTATGFQPATAADFAPVPFYGFRTPDDPTVLLNGLPLVRFKAIQQRALDLFDTIPSHDELRELQHTKIGHLNRIAELTKPRGEGGFGLGENAPQVSAERKKLERVEQELTRLTELKEVRTVRWNARGQLERNVSDQLLRGIPGGCVMETVEDAPLSELLKKGETITAAVERYRHRLRELAADRHRERSSPWPSSVAKAAAKELVDRLADTATPNLDSAIEHNLPISFATKRLQSQIFNVSNSPGAIAYAEMPDAIGLMCWLFHDQLLAKINAGFDESADDKVALDQAQREEAEAKIKDAMIAIQRHECSLIWHAETTKGEVIEFRSDTTPECVLGVRLRTQPRDVPGTSVEHAYNIAHPGG